MAPRVKGPSGEFAKLDPPPIAFADRERARDRSLFGLYQVISQGLEGTAMQSFASLPEEDRWALAFHAGTLAYGDAARGERIWREDAAVRAAGARHGGARRADARRARARRSAPTKRPRSSPISAPIPVRWMPAKPGFAAARARPAAGKPRRLCRGRPQARQASWRCPPISTGSSRSKRCSPRATATLMVERRAGDGRLPQRDRARPSPWPSSQTAWPKPSSCSTRPKRRSRPRPRATCRPSSAPSPSCFAKGWRRCWW